MKALWLVTWFPDRINFLNGDFIERYARAVSMHLPIVVLYVGKDPLLSKYKTEIIIEQKDDLTIMRGYYGMDNESIGVISKLTSTYHYFKMFNRLYRQAKSKHGSFDIIHVQIAYRAGLFALWLKLTTGIKYVLTEHSSWFMPPTYLFDKAPIITKWLTLKVLNGAKSIHAVSESLGTELLRLKLKHKSFTIIPNVVDTHAFYPQTKNIDTGIVQFVTITGNVYQKNTDGAIRAFATFINNGYKGTLHIVGPNDNSLKLLVKQLAIDDNIVFHGAVHNNQVSEIYRMCNVLIFFSRYETFGIAMTEAFCCGLPVIASKLEVTKESIVEGVNGIFVESENEYELAEKMISFSKNSTMFNKEKIANSAKAKYSYEEIAVKFETWYQQNLKG